MQNGECGKRIPPAGRRRMQPGRSRSPRKVANELVGGGLFQRGGGQGFGIHHSFGKIERHEMTGEKAQSDGGQVGWAKRPGARNAARQRRNQKELVPRRFQWNPGRDAWGRGMGFSIPTRLKLSAHGLRGTRYPGSKQTEFTTLQGLNLFRKSLIFNPFRVVELTTLPRVGPLGIGPTLG